MKTTMSIIAVCVIIISIQSVAALENNVTTKEYNSFTEIAGKGIADEQAKNWRADAQLMRITIPHSGISENQGALKYYTTEYCYIYRSGDKYFVVTINFEENEKGAYRTEEISDEDAKGLELDNLQPLNNWKVNSWSAFKIASNSYNMSLDRGDIISRLYFQTAEVNNSTTPIWYISIRDGIKGIDTNYTIDANTGDILSPKIKQEVPTEPFIIETEKDEKQKGFLESIDLILEILAALVTIGTAIWAIFKYAKSREK